ncbi:ras-related and estrogen-regulated growth inhibitor isoform X2 [Nasonia vitripennis]|uniref:small monomeric GTPase n=1 Tax=Nasonia vitripennis TaxID=7425 RepID=A0A7M7Q7I0_NASVI|nr:ras-related and estrogen-regulated growth inhibitor isoform X2 [Nasonia vitripennis]
MQSTGGWQFGFGGSAGIKDSSNSAKSTGRLIRVILLGQPGVGKTVRFASRRFIGEYDCSIERVYRVGSQDSLVAYNNSQPYPQPHNQRILPAASWEIADPPGNPAKAPSESRLRWADAVLLVYSVTDRVSFDETWRLRFLLNQARKSSKKLAAPVVLLVGNKTDLAGPPDGDRMVSTTEGSKRARDIEAHGFHEISARESYEQVTAVFVSVARLVLLLPASSSEEMQQQQQQQQHQLAAGGGAYSSSSFRLRASTDGSIDARRRQTVLQPLSKRRLSISARGAPH